jgi:hypothetical protein
MQHTIIILVLINLFSSFVPVYSAYENRLQNISRLSFGIKASENTDPDVVVQNSANFNASGATLGIRQKKGGVFKLKVRVPKVRDKKVKVTVKIAEEFTAHVSVKNKIFVGKAGESKIVFFVKVKKSINNIIPVGSLIDIPITLTDLQNGAEEEFILEVRD